MCLYIFEVVCMHWKTNQKYHFPDRPVFYHFSQYFDLFTQVETIIALTALIMYKLQSFLWKQGWGDPDVGLTLACKM